MLAETKNWKRWRAYLVVHQEQTRLKVALQASLKLAVIKVAIKNSHLQNHLVTQVADLDGQIVIPLNDFYPDDRLALCLEDVVHEVLLVEVHRAAPARVVLAQLTALQQAPQRSASALIGSPSLIHSSIDFLTPIIHQKQ
jgi:hypothetical protein